MTPKLPVILADIGIETTIALWLHFESTLPYKIIMKHRHTFFVPSGVKPPLEAIKIIPGNKKDPSVLSIKHLQAAREWKITIDSDELSTLVKILCKAHTDTTESERN